MGIKYRIITNFFFWRILQAKWNFVFASIIIASKDLILLTRLQIKRLRCYIRSEAMIPYSAKATQIESWIA